MNTATPEKLTDYPLFRLIIMLDDVEGERGPESTMAAAIAAAIREKLRIQTRRLRELKESTN